MTSFTDSVASLGLATPTPTPSISNSANQSLGQKDFLKLLTAQMQYQDPFNPTDNTQMIAQMAQFSSLSGITEMSTTLKAIQDKLGQSTVADATAYIGKTVLTEGNVAYGSSAGGLAGAVELDAPASGVTVTIADQNGATLKTLSLGAQPAGTIDYDWDGKMEDGKAAGTGPFKVTVTANDAKGSIAARNLVWAPVQSVTMSPTGTPTLSVAGLGNVATTAVRQIG